MKRRGFLAGLAGAAAATTTPAKAEAAPADPPTYTITGADDMRVALFEDPNGERREVKPLRGTTFPVERGKTYEVVAKGNPRYMNVSFGGLIVHHESGNHDIKVWKRLDELS